MICTEPLISISFAYNVNSKGLFDTQWLDVITFFVEDFL